MRQLAAIKDVTARETKRIDEVFTGRPLTTIPVGTAEDVEAAFAEARAAQIEWAPRPVTERVEVVRRYRDLVIENREFLMDLLQAKQARRSRPRRKRESNTWHASLQPKKKKISLLFCGGGGGAMPAGAKEMEMFMPSTWLS